MAFGKWQECPYCSYKPQSLDCIWKEGNHRCTCEKCKKEYEVNINYEFYGVGCDITPLN